MTREITLTQRHIDALLDGKKIVHPDGFVFHLNKEDNRGTGHCSGVQTNDKVGETTSSSEVTQRDDPRHPSGGCDDRSGFHSALRQESPYRWGFLDYSKPVLDAIRWLSSRCDGAAEIDGAGFAKCDTEFGHWLAGVDSIRSYKLGERALKLVRKYRKQLANGGFDVDSILDTQPESAAQKSPARVHRVVVEDGVDDGKPPWD